jgi:hypothetical protein
MEMEAFKQDLRKRGKKPNVVEGLVHSVEEFAKFLAEHNRSLSQAKIDDIDEYIEYQESIQKGLARKIVRGVALYYEFTNHPEIAKRVWTYRENAISKKRHVFLLKDFMGVEEAYVLKLAELGIANVNQMIEAGKSAAMREQLASDTGIPLDVILEYVKLADLTRIGALRRVRARLYYDAGFDTIDKIAQADPVNLREHFLAFVKDTGFDGIAPLPKELCNAVASAKQIERLVEY